MTLGLADPVFHPDPYPTFACLREREPVSVGRYYDGTPIWLVTAYEDVRAVLQDRRFVNDASKHSSIDVPAAFGIDPELRPLFERHMLGVDPPDHTQLRRLIAPAFTASRVEALRPFVQKVTDRLLDEIEAHDAVDLVDRFALPLPIAVIAKILGVPEAERENWRAWAGAFFETDAPHMVEFAVRLIRLRRAEPGDDLTTALVRVHDGYDGQLNDDQLIAMVMGLVGAGYRTTSRLIGTGAFILLSHADQLELLRAEPSLVPAAVEEMLRFRTPLEAAPALRYATEDVEIRGVTIRRGDIVQVFLGAANRDGARFADPDRFRVERTDNAHLSFGHGLHFCVAAQLARAEAEIAFRTLVARFPALALAVPPDQIEWHRSFSRGPIRLPVRLR